MKNKTILSLISLIPLLGFPLLAEESQPDAAPPARTLDELFTVECECKIPHYSCDECRYELGLVKLDPSLIRTPGKTNGLLTIRPVTLQNAQSLLPLHGEIVLNDTSLTHISPRVAGTVRTIMAALGKRSKPATCCSRSKAPNSGLPSAPTARTRRSPPSR